MPLDPVKVAVAVSKGLSAICASCTKYWDARDRGVPGDQCLAVKGCGSPLAGDCFHEYAGPLSDLSKLCFVCGGVPKYGLRVGRLVRVIGVCEKHVKMVHGVRAEGQNTEPQIDGAPKPAPEKKSLKAAIHEAEAYFRKKNGEDE